MAEPETSGVGYLNEAARLLGRNAILARTIVRHPGDLRVLLWGLSDGSTIRVELEGKKFLSCTRVERPFGIVVHAEQGTN